MPLDTETAPRKSLPAPRRALTTEVTVIHEEHNAKREGQPLPVHELIRLDAAAHPERTYSEHVAASRAILGAEYIETLRRIQAREGATRGDR